MKRQSNEDEERDVSDKKSKTLIFRRKPEQLSDNAQHTVLQRCDGHSNIEGDAMSGISRKDLWKEIETEIEDRMIESAFEKTPFDFLPEGELDDILSKIAKRRQCGDDLGILVSSLLLQRPYPVTAEEQSLVEYILDNQKPAIKLLCTILYAKHDNPYEAMLLLMRKAYHDDQLPAQWSNKKLRKEFHHHPLALLDEDLWSRAAIKEFQEKQKLFQAPVLTTNGKDLPGQFGQRTLPFIQRDTRGSGGAHGIVYKYTIHPNHFIASEKGVPRCIVAVKELRKSNDEVAHHWVKEVTALSKMNTLNQEHIVRFLMAFTRGQTEENPDDLEHYVVFEWADGGNLKDLWARFPRPRQDAAFTKWIMKQLHGLSQALSAAHYLLDDDGVYRGKSYRHGDLKPENILWFPWEGEDWGTLKICDWGEAKIHVEVTALRHATTTQFGTRRYEPPEVVVCGTNLSEAAKDARSRLYDLWSMGCVMTECIIWLVYGLDEQKRFNKSNMGDHGYSEHFYEQLKEGNAVQIFVHGAVARWLKHMMNDPYCRPGETAFGDALEIVSNGLLVVELPKGDLHPAECPGIQCDDSLGMPKPLSPTSSRSTLALPQAVQGLNNGVPEFSGLAVSSPVGTTLSNVQSSSRMDLSTSHPQIRQPESTNGLTINVTPAEDLNSSVSAKRSSGGQERYRAPDLASRLGKIVLNDHSDNYWRPPGSPTPAPQELSGEFLSPSDVRMAGATKRDHGNYAHPELNQEVWKFEVDNNFAAGALSHYTRSQSKAAQTTPDLCEQCAKVHARLWSPFFSETYKTAKLKQNAEDEECDLCNLFWQACIRNKAADWETITFKRVDSNLKICGIKSPAVSLFRNGAVSNAVTLQIGIEELSEPAHPLHFDIIRAWVHDCDKNHSKPICNPQGSVSTSRIPTRLIYVGYEGEHRVALKLTQRDEDLKWIALSYRWGGQPHFSTTRENIDEHIEGMSLAALPGTFQDAILMTRGLGCQYLWIDAVCIIQGEDGDFAEESKRMEDVYSGAYCVLAASYKNSFRLFHTRRSRASVALGSDNSLTGVIYASETIDNFKAHVLDGPLSLRGWVLQEHALARRTIFFTEYQTYWECGHGVRCETMTKMRNGSAALLGDPEFPKILKPAEHGERILRFQELYQQYSRLKLTADYDRPAAIDGLQGRLLRAMDVSGGFGVLEDPQNPGLLRRSLMWHRATDTLGIIKFPEDRGTVPSWSWMSVSGPIDYVRLAFSGFTWQHIQSPWSHTEAENTGRAIIAEMCVLETVKATEAPGLDIRLDIPADSGQKPLLATVLGIEKGDRETEDKQHCVLILEEMSGKDGAGRIQCRRVGAGIVEGRYLSKQRKTCLIF